MRSTLSSSRRLAFVLAATFTGFALLILRFGVLPAFNNTRGDFANYYTAACLVREGAPLARAYQDFVWFQMEMDRKGIVNQVGGFIPHPPPTAIVFLPLTFLPAIAARNVWTAVNLLLVGVCIYGLSRLTRLPWLATAVIFLGTGFGLINNFLFGQMYLLLTATLVLGLLAQQQGKDLQAGMWLGLLLPMKYIGILFVAYFAWRRRWRLVLAAGATVAAVTGAAALLAGVEPFRVFLTEVFPRHWRGEIQDPFAILFQSWASLFRRLFVYNATLNPAPPLACPPAFHFLSAAAFWGFTALAVWLFAVVRFAAPRHHFLFEIGLLPLWFLLVSPSGTTYHFLLLTLTTTAFAAILLEQQRAHAAAALAVLFIVINLPHYVKLMPLAQGWLTPLGYSRLWLLLLFGVLAWRFFRPLISLRPTKTKLGRVLAVAVTLIASLSALAASRGRPAPAEDGATWLALEDAEFKRHQGLLIKHPDLGRRRLVFSYCEFWNEQYTIFSADSGRWTPLARRNYYHPDLAGDDASLLVQTIVHGRDEIWLSRRQGEEPHFVVAGSQPSWREAGKSFVYVNGDALFLAVLAEEQLQLRVLRTAAGEQMRFYDPACSPHGNLLAYCVEDGNAAAPENRRFQLRLHDFSDGRDELVLAADEPLEQPAWSPDESVLLFARRHNATLTLAAVKLARRRMPAAADRIHLLTTVAGHNTSPVWDAGHDRILFTSDRGRGLEFSALFALPVPPALR
ncbi:MAG: glycosyltransferase 87 family protein [candidate division KSB1 bacterium]|nr:glycosyltransferase 87 family protein [candidate division KSB1 bacterium]MDZ7275885.1 glycosyltransferase 87 family protein [candidate division KSB1 bacterium]MDZ7287635.1 glycosyltransferase 87 family protein [candidate division KSB1 bacterium]MDZ7306797.1 glycosyltransferase 87 family protein [candidate division KSB1 bacterium]MDZ7350613.1 glycosyltransferase 87 family protein [candidate division KSB1 bacterium]